ncbi:MAG: DUF2232 domain-containing protein [Sulfobacillus sp.]
MPPDHQANGLSRSALGTASGLVAARRPLADGLLALLVAVALAAVGTAFGPWGALLFLSWPPLVVLTYRQGWRLGAALAILLSLGLSLIWPGPLAVPLIIWLAGPVWCGWRLRQGTALGQLMAESVVGQIGLLVVLGVVTVLVTSGVGGFAASAAVVLRDYGNFAQSTAQAARSAALAGGSTAAQAAAQGQLYLQELHTFLPIVPAVAATVVLINTGLGLLWSLALLRWVREDPKPLPAFATWSSPPWLALAYLVGLGLFFLWPQNTAGSLIGANLLTVSQAVLLVHGGALLYFAAAKLGLGRGFRIVGLALLLLIPVSAEVLAVLGVVDSALDMRRLRTQKT